jgi:hypothetical protein
MARNILSLYKVGIQAILSICFVEGMKITPINGSKPFLGCTGYDPIQFFKCYSTVNNAVAIY